MLPESMSRRDGRALMVGSPSQDDEEGPMLGTNIHEKRGNDRVNPLVELERNPNGAGTIPAVVGKSVRP